MKLKWCGKAVRSHSAALLGERSLSEQRIRPENREESFITDVFCPKQFMARVNGGTSHRLCGQQISIVVRADEARKTCNATRLRSRRPDEQEFYIKRIDEITFKLAI